MKNKVEEIMENYRAAVKKIDSKYTVKPLKELDTKKLDESILYQNDFIMKLENQGKNYLEKEENKDEKIKNDLLIRNAKTKLDSLLKEKQEKQENYEKEKAAREEKIQKLDAFRKRKVILPNGREILQIEKDNIDKQELGNKARRELTTESRKISSMLIDKRLDLIKLDEDKKKLSDKLYTVNLEISKAQYNENDKKKYIEEKEKISAEISKKDKEEKDIRKEMSELSKIQEKCQGYLEYFEEKDKEEAKRLTEILYGKNKNSGKDDSEKVEVNPVKDNSEKVEVNPVKDDSEKVEVEPVKDDSEKVEVEPVKDNSEKVEVEPVKDNSEKVEVNPVKDDSEKVEVEPVKDNVILDIGKNELEVNGDVVGYYRTGFKNKRELLKDNNLAIGIRFSNDRKKMKNIDYTLLTFLNEKDPNIAIEYLKVIGNKDNDKTSLNAIKQAMNIKYKFDKEAGVLSDLKAKRIARYAHKLGLAEVEGIREKGIFDRIKDKFSNIKLLTAKKENQISNDKDENKANAQKQKAIQLINSDRKKEGIREQIEVDNTNNKIEEAALKAEEKRLSENVQNYLGENTSKDR